MKIITIATQKGGTGKTTTAAAIAQAAAQEGKKVLAIDLDAQRNLTFITGADENYKSSYELLQGEPIKKTIQTTKQGIDVIAASWGLSSLQTDKGSVYKLETALQDVRKSYDIAIIDTPPHINVLQYNALQACDILIIPMLTSIFSLKSLSDTLETAQAFKKTNKRLHTIGAILTQYEGRSVLVRNIEETVKESLKANNVRYMGKIRKAIALQEAQTLQQPLYSYAPKSKPAQDYMSLLNTILKEN